MDLQQIFETAQKRLLKNRARLLLWSKGIIVVVGAYLSASTLSATVIGYLGKAAIDHRPNFKASSSSLRVKKLVNYRDLRKIVEGRNVFNSDGEFPVEEEREEKEEEKVENVTFDQHAQCRQSSLNLTLVGTIYLADKSQSLATIKEKGYNVADIYKEGDAIIGQEEATVFAITPLKVVLNNNGSKECLELVQKEIQRKSSRSLTFGFDDNEDEFGEEMENEGFEDEEMAVAKSANVVLERSFVESSLGPGFSKVLEDGRLVPFDKDGKMTGFKIIGVRPKSIWRRIGLNNGDVITGVNDISMAQPDQGFALYQALQESGEIRLRILKSSKLPRTINVEIK